MKDNERESFCTGKGWVREGAVLFGGVTYMRRTTAIIAACISPRLPYRSNPTTAQVLDCSHSRSLNIAVVILSEHFRSAIYRVAIGGPINDYWRNRLIFWGGN